MLKIIKTFFQSQQDNKDKEVRPEHAMHLAASALLIEVGRSDFDLSAEEIQHVTQLLGKHFKLNAEDIAALVELGIEEAESAISLHPYIKIINDSCSDAEKIQLVELMWQVAYSDNIKDKYEEHMIRKVAELLYLSHSEFIQSRHKAEKISAV
ncbi:MAG: TerB family tellurite resistance protein [Gammaproteobacteria bacterium]|nr:TerB family tellurite resistance protein [Gammaproteobacteria bacterium]